MEQPKGHKKHFHWTSRSDSQLALRALPPSSPDRPRLLGHSNSVPVLPILLKFKGNPKYYWPAVYEMQMWHRIKYLIQISYYIILIFQSKGEGAKWLWDLKLRCVKNLSAQNHNIPTDNKTAPIIVLPQDPGTSCSTRVWQWIPCYITHATVFTV